MNINKLISKESIDKKRRRNQLVVSLLLVLLMIISIAGYGIDREKTDSLSYNGFEFVGSGAGWQVVGQSFNLVTRYLPNEVENVSFTGSWSKDYLTNNPLYFIANSEEAKIAAAEIARNIPISRAQYACFEEDANLSLCSDLPIKACSDNIIYINYIYPKNESIDVDRIPPKIYTQENCIIIETKYSDLVRAADRFLFSFYEIM